MKKQYITFLLIFTSLINWAQTPTHIDAHADKQTEPIWSNPYYIGALILGVVLLIFIYRWSKKLVRSSQRMKQQQEEKDKE